jgi:hypothetical protein
LDSSVEKTTREATGSREGDWRGAVVEIASPKMTIPQSKRKNRQSYGLTLPEPSDTRDSVVSNILSSLATLDETAQLQWVHETSRQVENERAFQRREGAPRDHYNGRRSDDDALPMFGVGYKDRSPANSLGIIHSAPSPAVPMGRTTKQGFFKRFIGIGQRVQIESDLLISTNQPKRSLTFSTPVCLLFELG